MRSTAVAVSLAFCLGLPAGPLVAQCPDGTPPPCAGQHKPPPAPNSIAVLPFGSHSPDTTDVYLAEGMTEEVANQLARVGRIQVRAPSLAAAQWHRTPDAIEAGRRLGVAWVVEGYVRHVGSSLQVSATLLRVGSGDQAWGGRFPRAAGDVFAVQAEVAESIAVAVIGRLAPGERAVFARRPTRNNESYRLYLYGNSLMARRTPEETRRAVGAYTQALQLDPLFAGAWARLAYARGNQYAWGFSEGIPQDSLLTLAVATSRRALSLDSTSADAWLSMGQARFFSRDVGAAHEALERGLQLDSLNGELAFQYGAIYASDGWGLGLPAIAEPFFRRALQLDPTLRNVWRHLALAAVFSGQLAEAEARWDSALAFGPWVPAYDGRSAVRYWRGDGRGALADVAAAEALDSFPRSARRSLFLVALGDSGPARVELAHLRALADSGQVVFASMAQFAMALGLREEALSALERLRASPDRLEARCGPSTPCSASLRTWKVVHDPRLATLRGEPRFQRLLEETRPVVPWLPASGR